MQPSFGSRQRTDLRRNEGVVEATLIFLPDGKTDILVTDGADFEGAKDKIAELVAALNAEGAKFNQDGETEQHRHPDDAQKVRVGSNQVRA